MKTAGEPSRRAMFSRIAPGYDRINAAISLGLDNHWRRAVPRSLPAGWAPRRMLDVCCGTGALLGVLAQAFPGAEAVGLDFAPGMLAAAAARFYPAANPPWLVEGDQNALPFADGCFDLVTNAFGLRNSVDLRQALVEMHRVTAPGGVMAVLEITRPDKGIFARLFEAYFNLFVPAFARCLGGDPGAYAYLPASVASFVTREELAGIAGKVWGGETAVVPLFGSTVSLFLARRRPWPIHATKD